MGHAHPSTPDQRIQWVSRLLASDGVYGSITQLSREANVSRPTLYAWRALAQAAVQATFAPVQDVPRPSTHERQILTLWIAHATTRGIQHALRELQQQGISLATITDVLHQAGQRAQTWLQTHMPSSVRALALDEIYAKNRHGAYLNVVDVHSGAVWASVGPLPVDSDSWTLVLWELADAGLRWERVVIDGGAALQKACATAMPSVVVQGDIWHVLATCGKVQGRLDRIVTQLQTQTPIVERQAARIAVGQRPQGRRPKTDVVAHAQDVTAAMRGANGLRSLTQELRRLLDVVVLGAHGLLTAAERQTELDALLALLDEVVPLAEARQQPLIRTLVDQVRTALPHLLTFVPHVVQVQADLATQLAPDQQALLAWAWQRRRALGWQAADILDAIPSTWRAAARILLATWADAVRVSSAVERWHSILRPHLAVHRTLDQGMLALLAVWHNHRVFPRGRHKGQNPLQLSGIADAPTDWLTVLGYPPAAATDVTQGREVPATRATDTWALAA